jgi:hypothetical protein
MAVLARRLQTPVRQETVQTLVVVCHTHRRARNIGRSVVVHVLLGAAAQILAHGVGGDEQRALVHLLNVCGGFPAQVLPLAGVFVVDLLEWRQIVRT